jgi:hypothetical protein
MSRFTAAELTALCSTPAGLVALFQLVLAGNVDITTAAVTTPLAAMVTAGAITQARATALATAASVVP